MARGFLKGMPLKEGGGNQNPAQISKNLAVRAARCAEIDIPKKQ